jgi:hypothetical protein
MKAPVRGAFAGGVATVPMSALMLAAGKVGLVGQQPPEAITRTVVRRVTGSEPQGAAGDVLSSVTHLGFGAVAGAGYGLLPPARHVPPPVRGAVLGLGLWFVSYQGWVPGVLGALPPADRDRKDRVAVMAAAHAVFGAVVGTLDDRWRQRGQEET